MLQTVEPHQLFKPAPRPVPVNRLTHPLAGREAEAARRARSLLRVRLRPRLQHESGRDKASAAFHPEILRALRQSSDGCHVPRFGRNWPRRKGACGPSRGGAPRSGAQPWSPCVRESRGAACERSCLAEMCASLERSPMKSSLAALIGGGRRQVNGAGSWVAGSWVAGIGRTTFQRAVGSSRSPERQTLKTARPPQTQGARGPSSGAARLHTLNRKKAYWGSSSCSIISPCSPVLTSLRL